MVTFTADQQMALLEWLESLDEAELNLNDIIEGLKNGTLTTSSEINIPLPN